MNTTVSNVLRKYLTQQQQINPSISEATISKKLKIPPTTFNRLINGYSQPNLDTLVKLSRFIPEFMQSFPDELNEVLTNYSNSKNNKTENQKTDTDSVPLSKLKESLSPTCTEFLRVTLKKQNSHFVGKELEQLLSDKNIFICWVLSFATKGVTEEAVKNCLGQRGVKALHTLLEKDIVIKNKEGSYKIKNKNIDTVLSYELTKKHVAFLVDQFNSHHLGGDTNYNIYIHYATGSVNQKGMKKIMEVHRQAHEQVQNIINNPENDGDIPVFSTGCNDVLV